MPQDPIQRWEWEGGAIAVDVSAAPDERRDQASGRMDEPSARERQDDQPSHRPSSAALGEETLG